MRFTKGQVALVVGLVALSLLFAGIAERIYAYEILPYCERWCDGKHQGETEQTPARRGSAPGDQEQPRDQTGQAKDQQQQAGADVRAASVASDADALARASLRAGRVAFDVSLVFGVLGVIGVIIAAIALDDWLGWKRRRSERSRLVVDAVYADVHVPEWRIRNIGAVAAKLEASVWHGDRVEFLAPEPALAIAGAGRLKPGDEMAFTSDGVGRFAVVTVTFTEDDGARGHCFAVFEAKSGPSRMRKVGECYRYE